MNSRLALVALLAGVAACPVLCAQPMPSAGLPAEAVQQALGLAAQAAQALAPPGARIRVNPGALDPRLQLAACGKIEPALSAGQPLTLFGEWNGLTLLPLSVWSEEGFFSL